MAGQWYMAIGGHQVGPVSEDEIRTNLVNGSIDANTLLFTAGMANWTPLSAVPQFAAQLEAGRRGAAPAARRRAGRRAHDIDFEIFGERHAVRRGRARPRRERRRRSRRADVHDAGHPDGDRLRRWQPAGEPGLHGRAARRRQAPAHRREPVHDGVHERRATGKQRVAFAAPYPGKILPMHLRVARRRADLPEGFVPLRGARRVDRHRLPEARSASACSAAKASSCSGSTATASASSTPAARARARARRRARRCASTPAASSRSSRPCSTTSSSSAASRPRCSAAKALLRHAHRPRQGVAAVAAAQPPRRPHLQGRAADGGRRKEEGSVLDRIGVGNLIDGD